MQEIRLGRVLSETRRARGVTQETLAEFLGVSKAAVSKWETGAAYPDLPLVPKIAGYFGISVDTLLGYSPQMRREEIRAVHDEVNAAFAAGRAEAAVARCRSLAQAYPSCYPLLHQLGALLLNHFPLAETPEAGQAMLQDACRLFGRVRREADSLDLQKEAAFFEAAAQLTLGRPEEVPPLLECGGLRLAPEVVLAAAHNRLGEPEKGQEILQVGLYQCIVELLNLLVAYMGCCDAGAMAESYARGLGVSRAFRLETLHPLLLLGLHITAAHCFCRLGNADAALDALQAYTDLAAGLGWPIALHGDDYFTRLDGWMESCLTLGGRIPRGEALTRRSVAEALTADPAFAPLADTARFRAMVQTLRHLG